MQFEDGPHWVLHFGTIRIVQYHDAELEPCLDFIRLVEEVAVSHAVDGIVDDLAAAGASEFVRDVEVGAGECVGFAVGAFVGNERNSRDPGATQTGRPSCSPLNSPLTKSVFSGRLVRRR